MTDKEIIKALECCIKAKTNADCEALKCPFYDNEIDICMYVNNEEVLYANALDLINRQQAENKELKTENLILSQKRFNIFERIEFTDKLKKQAKAEAIKEVFDKIKAVNRWSCIDIRYFDKVKKEMAGEDK